MSCEKQLKHTPGPWRWCGYYLIQDCPATVSPDKEGKETNPFATPCEHPIADDGSGCGDYDPIIDTEGPDARLIAAAPDLLKALSEMECAWCGQIIGGEPLYEGHECQCAEARAAVKKARGE